MTIPSTPVDCSGIGGYSLQRSLSYFKKIKEEYNQLSYLPETVHLLLEWGISLLKIKILKGKKHLSPTPRKILLKIDSIARHLIAVIGENSLKKLTVEERFECYLETIQRAISTRNNNTIRANLRAFNHWLEKD